MSYSSEQKEVQVLDNVSMFFLSDLQCPICEAENVQSTDDEETFFCPSCDNHLCLI